MNMSSLRLAIVIGAVALATPACVDEKPSSSGSVELSELMYHPSGEDSGGEFIELHNPSEDAVDLSDWCFVKGIAGCFPAGTTIDPGGFVVMAADTNSFVSAHGQGADGNVLTQAFQQGRAHCPHDT